jgi:hypothetical protein
MRVGILVQPAIVNPGNAVVLELHQQAHLGQKAGLRLLPGRLQQCGMEELHRDLALMGANGLLRPVDDPPATLGEGFT